MTLKRQNVSSERVCLFATVWKRAVYKFTHRYTKNYLFCAGRPPSRCFVLGSTFAFRFIGHFYCSQNITAHQEQKRKPTTVFFFFLYSAIESVLHCCTVQCVCMTHTQTHGCAWTNQSGCAHFIFLVPLNCMEIITFLINYCKKCFNKIIKISVLA